MRNIISYYTARFARDEEGLALTEYLVLLGLLIGGVIVAVTLFGQGLSDAWDSWTAWFGGSNVTAPAP